MDDLVVLLLIRCNVFINYKLVGSGLITPKPYTETHITLKPIIHRKANPKPNPIPTFLILPKLGDFGPKWPKNKVFGLSNDSLMDWLFFYKYMSFTTSETIMDEY